MDVWWNVPRGEGIKVPIETLMYADAEQNWKIDEFGDFGNFSEFDLMTGKGWDNFNGTMPLRCVKRFIYEGTHDEKQ